jgi:hypothetical protein
MKNIPRPRSIYTVECVCGRQIHSETLQTECPSCHRTLVLSWPGENVPEPTSELAIDSEIERPSSKM